MLSDLLPVGVVAVETTQDRPALFDFTEERGLIAGWVPQRQREFVTARRCAHEALHLLGVVPTAIGRGPDRAPQWPDGVVGSITHCDDYRAAAVARRIAFASLGIDAEPLRALPSTVLDVVLTAEEVEQLARLRTDEATLPWETLVFSAKESTYKALYPLTGRWLDFHDVRIEIDRTDASLAAYVRIAGDRSIVLRGLYRANQSLLTTAILIPAMRPVNDLPRR